MRYLITGGTGFLGEALIQRLYKEDIQLRIIARNEGKLIALKEKYSKIEIFTGDISDPFIAKQACLNVDSIFHLAAFKHVGLAETFTKETIDTNIIGSINILNESLNNKPKFLIAISTDKAAQATGTYGASKLIMERLFHQYAAINKDTAYRIVRYGNVLYSTGSVLCKWKALIQEGKAITVTDPNATRFFWTVDQALDLIFNCLNNSTNSQPFCPTMKAISINNLLNAMVIKYSGGKSIEINTIGLQPGENLHEKILDNGPYSNQVDQFTISEIIELI